MEVSYKSGLAAHDNFDGLLRDITEPHAPVEVLWRDDKTVLWVNIGATCVLRICRIEQLSVDGDEAGQAPR